MTYHKLEQMLLAYPGSVKTFPFDETTAVFKVLGKIFALVSLDRSPLSINLKCDPDDALILRSQFKAIRPGYHMNKDHWNTITVKGDVDSRLLIKLIDDSYKLVLMGLSQKARDGLPAHSRAKL